MKFNFKKIASVLATTVMLGSTIAFAAAAWPDPFVKDGASQAAVVIGAGTSADMVAATSIQDALNAKVTSAGTSVVSGEGDSYLLEKTSTKLHVGDNLLNVVSATVTDDKLPTLLKEGKYLDSNNDEFDYTQKITLASPQVTMFNDNDYKEDTPIVGIKFSSGDPVLNYTLSFSDQPNTANIKSTGMLLMGKEYYVLDATNTTLTFLDSAESAILAEGETKTLSTGGKSYEASINFIGQSSVKLQIGTQVTNSLAVGQTYKLSDGSYVGIRDIMYNSKDAGVSKVDFSIGSGKLKLTHNSEVEMNDNSISRLKAYIGNTSAAASTTLSTVTLEWKADGDMFVAPGAEVTMPGFKAVKMVWGGVNYPIEETIEVAKSSDTTITLKDFPLKSGAANIDLLYSSDNKNYSAPGKEANKYLRTSSNGSMTFDTDTDSDFIVSWTDGKDAESYMMRTTGFVKDGNYNKTTVQYYKDGAWTDLKTVKYDLTTASTDSFSIGNVELTTGIIDNEGRSILISKGSSTGISFNTLYSKEGMKLQLPWQNTTDYTGGDAVPTCSNWKWGLGQVGPVNVSNTTGTASTGDVCYRTTWNVPMYEKDKDGNIAGGKMINLTLGFNSATTPQVSLTAVGGDTAVQTAVQLQDTKVYRSVVYSNASSEILWDKSGDQYSAKVINHGDEATVKVYLTAPTVTSTGSSAVKVVSASEVDSVKDMNLIVVGGACINKVAAMIVNGGSDVALCGDAWAAKTGAGVGKYLIQVAASPVNAGKVAVLIAGYEADQTKTAADKVAKEGVDASKTGSTVYPLAA